MIYTERRPSSILLTYGLAFVVGAILLLILIKPVEQFAWWYVRTIEAAG
jgi:hypothetical protein